MSKILSVATEEPSSCVSATETKEFLASLLPPTEAQRFQRLVETSRIRTRHTLMSLRELQDLKTFEARNSTYREQAIALGERVGVRALRCASIGPRDIDIILVASSTGHMVPTLDQHLASRLGLRTDVMSVPLTGLGCAGGIRAMRLAADLLSKNGTYALVVSADLCSPWLQICEPSPEDVVSNIFFGDGTGAVVIGRGQSVKAPEIVAHHVELWPGSLGVRGARLTATGFRHFCSPALPRLLRRNLPRTVGHFLSQQGLSLADLRFFVVNPSDHRVLETVQSTLDLSPGALQPAWEAWEQHGNTLSAGPLYVLRALETSTPPVDGDLGLVLVFGPGIICEMLLVRWRGRLRGGDRSTD